MAVPLRGGREGEGLAIKKTIYFFDLKKKKKTTAIKLEGRGGFRPL